MLTDLLTFLASLRLTVANRSDLLLEIAALRHQLEVLQRRGGRPRFRREDRRFWIWLSRRWPKWRSALVIVQPDTVVGWHRQGYRLFWRWRSRGKPGRPRIPAKHIAFIQRISRENPLWGEDRIAQEMKLKLGIEHSASTIRRYMITEARSPSSTWRSFLRNHASEIYALDLTPQVMWDFSICYVLVLIDHRTRRLVHIGMTRNPTLDWVKQQVRDACPWEGPRFIIHDNDGIFGQYGRGQKFRCALDGWLWKVMGIRGIPTPVRAPDCNAICERVMGTLKREALNHFVFVSEAHLRRTLWEFRRFYNTARPHQGIGAIPAELDEPRVPLVLLEGGRLVGELVLGGLHHDYRLAA